MSLNFKIKPASIPFHKQTNIKHEQSIDKNTKSIDNEKNDIECCSHTFVNIYASKTLHTLWFPRISCILLIFPLFLLNRDDIQHMWKTSIPLTGARIASCLYLCLMPISAHYLQLFSYTFSVHSYASKLISCVLCCLCIVLGNIAAILFLVQDPGNVSQLPFFFLSSALSIGSLQLLFLLEKGSIFRVMFCTAIAVLVVTLCILAFQASSSVNGKRFYQTASFPFILLFFETTRSHSVTTELYPL